MGEDPNVTWLQADGQAIEANHFPAAWHAGHVNDIYPLGNDDILVGADTGGVWHISPANTQTNPPSHFATPLSQDWGNPDIACLAGGPDGPLHVYAGCHTDWTTASERLYETDPTASDPLNRWHAVNVPSNTGTIYRLLTFKSPRRIVMACDGGVYWADIPEWLKLPGPGFRRGRVYTWQSSAPIISSATGLALGPDATIAVGAKGQGFFHGQWKPRASAPTVFDLTLEAATPARFDLTQQQRTSLASCETNPRVMYAVAAAPEDANKNDPIAAVLYSSDGGRSWNGLNPTIAGGTKLLKDDAGYQGYYNNCIAVSPADPKKVAIGWQNGIYLSTDGANTFSAFGGSPAIHHDVHGLVFDGRHSTEPRLYIGSDGGIIMTPDLGHTFVSAYNQFLLNLQCMSTLERNFWGTFSVSPRFANLVGSGLQDNGTVYSLLGETAWKAAEGGDGTLAGFLKNGEFIYADVGSAGGPVYQADWQDSFQRMGDAHVVPIVQGTSTEAGGLDDPTTEPIPDPQWHNKAQELMYALAGDNGPVYGLFAQSNGSNAHWEYIGNVFPHPLDGPVPGHTYASGVIWSFGTVTGSSVFIGTTGGRIFLLDTASKAVRALPIAQPNSDGLPTRIVVVSDTLAFATYNTSTSGALLRWDGQKWSSLGANQPDGVFPNQRVYGLALTDKNELFAATEDRVYVSRSNGEKWDSASTGLPRMPHCAELRFTKNPQAGGILYLSTFGHSVWSATLELPPPAGPSQGGIHQYTGWNGLIGSLADGTLHQIIGGGVSPVPPIGPEMLQRLAAEYQNLIRGAAALQAVAAVMPAQLAAAKVEQKSAEQIEAAAQQVITGTAALQQVNARAGAAGLKANAGLPLQQASQRVLNGAATLHELGPELAQSAVDPAFKAQYQAALDQITQATSALEALARQAQGHAG